mgnify:CR=1 FL=1
MRIAVMGTGAVGGYFGFLLMRRSMFAGVLTGEVVDLAAHI